MKKKKKGQDGNKQSMNYEDCLLTTFLFFFFFLNQQPLKLHNYRVWVYFVDECEFGLFKILEKPWLSVHPLTDRITAPGELKEKKKKAQLELQEVFFCVFFFWCPAAGNLMKQKLLQHLQLQQLMQQKCVRFKCDL